MNDNIDDMGKSVMSIIVRFIGMFLLLAGLWVAFQVMMEALELYREPQKIERFATAIEKGSNIDRSLSSFRNTISEEQDENGLAKEPATPAPAATSGSNVRVSYFLAWIIVLMLLMLIGSISLRAVKTGGELVLFDMQIKQFAKMLVKETSRLNQ
jgi:hypothetical protein